MSDSRNTDIVNWPANLVILLDILVYERRNILLCRVRSAHQPKKDGARSAPYPLNIIDSVYRKNTGKMTTEASSAQKQNRGKHRLSSILPVSRIF
jgi:hypothetical protein